MNDRNALKRIVTVTPNPAMDITYHAGRITLGSSHRVTIPISRAGGKGLNVARTAHQQGYTVLAIAPVGGPTGIAFTVELESSGVPHRLIPVEADTRRSIAIVDTVNSETSIFNEQGSPLRANEWEALSLVVAESLPPFEGHAVGVLVGSGSLPPGAPDNFYSDLVAAGHNADVPVVIDTSGVAILTAAAAGADLLKPNNYELVEATGEHNLVYAAFELIKLGAGMVLVSAGAEGMMMFDSSSPATYWSARLPAPLTGNPTGAGDAGVAAAAAALASGITDPEEILRKATAWSAAAVLMSGAGEISPRHAEFANSLVITRKDVS